LIKKKKKCYNLGEGGNLKTEETNTEEQLQNICANAWNKMQSHEKMQGKYFVGTTDVI
jgi:hypothetical protein